MVLPHFGVYHPQKPEKIRVVFDSAAETNGVSLNKLLLSGPDLTNSLFGVLLRFRQNPVAVTADIEQMFYSFFVSEEHRDFLRFLWFRNNDPCDEIIHYRMKVHLFGNTSSTAVATLGLRKTADEGQHIFGKDAKEFVHKNFYDDDGLISRPTTEQATDLVQRTQAMLATANLRLHKISSNYPAVSAAFPSEDRSVQLQDLDMSKDACKPVQRSLGVCWDTHCFTFRVGSEPKPFTKRGVLSTTSSLYDPLGLAAPVTIQGKFLLREMTSHLKERQLEEWDQPLPVELKASWDNWCDSLVNLQNVQVPHAYSTIPPKDATRVELHVFCDAYTRGIAAVAYFKVFLRDGTIEVSFVIGKAKLAPLHANTVPRLELCAAVLTVELGDLIKEEQAIELDSTTYYSDSKVVLGYIVNQTRRFYVYVSYRVGRIRNSSNPEQWYYVPTDRNPADLETRSVTGDTLQDSVWINGPEFLPNTSLTNQTCHEDQEVPSKANPEVKFDASVMKAEVKATSILGTERFSRFSNWSSLVRALSRVIKFIQSYRSKKAKLREEGEAKKISNSVEIGARAMKIIIANVQQEAYGDVI